MMFLRTALVTMMLSFPQALTAQENLVFNGRFDSADSGWILTNGAHLIPPFPIGGTEYSVFLYNSSPSLSALPTASQTINSLTPGLVYVVSGDYQMVKDQMPGGSPPDPSFGVFMDNIVYFQTVASGNYDWQNFSFLYTAANSSAVLSLSAQMNGTWVPYSIDNISMAAIPEPATYALAGLGLAALSFWRRKP